MKKEFRVNIAKFALFFWAEVVQKNRFDSSADQALFLRNGDLIHRWVALKNGLSDRLAAMDNSDVAEEYYMSVFSRMPATEEAKEIKSLLDQSNDRQAGIQQLVWAGLASDEFRFNH